MDDPGYRPFNHEYGVRRNRTITRRMAVSAAALALVGGVMAGCGGGYDAQSGAATSDEPNGVEKLPAKEILTTSAAAMGTASSVTVSGSAQDDGSGPELSLDLVLGTGVGEGTTSLGGTPLMEFRETGGKMYWKITREGAEAILGPGEASTLIGGRWLVAPADADSDEGLGPGAFGDKDELLASLVQEGATATVTGTGEVKGTPVVFVRTKGSDGASTLAIQTVGEPYVVQVKGKEAGNIEFTNWNAPVTVTAPTGAVSPDELMKDADPSSSGSSSG
ncbi:MAG: hypothetical protein FJW78_02005 [Actinobacteria bacterium]|nr:hypothetical protein [Actinomycetota bacterium]